MQEIQSVVRSLTSKLVVDDIISTSSTARSANVGGAIIQVFRQDWQAGFFGASEGEVEELLSQEVKWAGFNQGPLHHVLIVI